MFAAYHNLWHVKKAFRISKSKLEIRQMSHFTRRRFIVLKAYKELERVLRLAGMNISVDKVIDVSKTITVALPLSDKKMSRTMILTSRQKKIEQLFKDDF